MGICGSKSSSSNAHDATNTISKKQQAPSKSSSTLSNNNKNSTKTTNGFSYQRGVCALEYWEPVEELGEGSISSIHVVKKRPHRIDVPYKERVEIMSLASKDTPTTATREELFVLKSIIKTYVKNEAYLQEMRNEIATMSQLNHPNVVRVYEAYERKRHIYLIMDYCSGGDLVGREPNEAEACHTIHQVLSAVAYLHARNIVHRDIKLENIMFDKPHKNAQVKIIDFGLAAKYLDTENLTGRVGTLYSMSPQVLQGVYDYKCDLWSIGVVTYILLVGMQPFWGPPREMPWEERRKIIMDRILRGKCMSMTGPVWNKVSGEAKLFVHSLLQVDPKKRPTAAQALKSPWMKQTASLKVEYKFPNHEQQCQQVELKHNARIVLGQKLSTAEIVQLKRSLEYTDTEGKGTVCLTDFVDALRKTRLTANDIYAIVPDTNIDCPAIDYVSLMNSIVDSKSRRESERMAEAFSLVGGDAGKLSSNQIYEALKDVIDDDTLDAVMSKLKIDEDGNVSIQQVLDMAEKQHVDAITSLSSPKKAATQETNLLRPQDVVLPGGSNEGRAHPKYIYDTETDSLRELEA